MAELPLLGTRVLIVEDDFWQAEDGRDRLIEAGAEIVAMTGSVAAALKSAASRPTDIGLLDINLAGHESFDVARALLSRGVPVLFLTGYEASILPPDLANVPMITKPTEWPIVIAQLGRMLGKPVEEQIDADGPQA